MSIFQDRRLKSDYFKVEFSKCRLYPAGKCRFGAKLRKEHPGRPRRTEPVELLDFGRRCVHQHRLAGLVPRRRDRSDPALQQTALLPRNRACLLEPRRQGRRRELPPLLPANPRAGELPLQHQGHRYDPTLRRSLLRARHRRQSEGRRREGRHLRRRRRVETFRPGRASGRRRRLETHLLRAGLRHRLPESGQGERRRGHDAQQLLHDQRRIQFLIRPCANKKGTSSSGVPFPFRINGHSRSSTDESP